MANSGDPDKMPHNAAFHQGVHYLLRQNRTSEKQIQYCLKIITHDPSLYTMANSDLTVYIFMESGLKRVKRCI